MERWGRIKFSFLDFGCVEVCRVQHYIRKRKGEIESKKLYEFLDFGCVDLQRYKRLEAHMGLIFELPPLVNHMEVELAVQLMDVLLGFHSLNPICNSILIGGIIRKKALIFSHSAFLNMIL